MSDKAGLPQFDMAPLTSEAFWTIVSFLALLWLMHRFILPEIQRVLDERIERINREIVSAEQLRCENEALKGQYELQLKGIRSEAENIRREAERQANEYHERAVKEVERELRRKKEMLREEVEFAKIQAIAEIRNVAAEVALATVEKLLERQVDSGDMERLLEQSIVELQAERSKREH